MARPIDAAARVRLALVILLSGALALLVPSLSAANPDASSGVMLAAVAAVVAAVLEPRRRVTTVPALPLAAPPGGTVDAPSFLAARVTDTARHPVRPRAPGLA